MGIEVSILSIRKYSKTVKSFIDLMHFQERHQYALSVSAKYCFIQLLYLLLTGNQVFKFKQRRALEQLNEDQKIIRKLEMYYTLNYFIKRFVFNFQSDLFAQTKLVHQFLRAGIFKILNRHIS